MWIALLSCWGLLSLSQAKVVSFEVTLTWETASPDGFEREVILTNGQLPGPPLYVDQGDDVDFLVQNKLPFEITIHFHGIEQLGTPWSDGVPGVSQRPIKPGHSYLYQWNANEYGSFFYHAHEKGRMNDGLYGAIYVQPASNIEKPFDLITNSSVELKAIIKAEKRTQPIILADWTHLTSTERHAAQINTGLDSWCTNSLLFNGKGSAICLDQETINININPLIVPFLNGTTYTDLGCLPPVSSVFQGPFPHNYSAEPFGLWSGCKPSQGPTEVLTVDNKDSWASYNIISATSTALLMFSMDEHPLWVYAIDGRYVRPTVADALTIGNGQRYSVMVKLKEQPLSKYNIRAVSSDATQIMNGTAFLSYAGAHINNSSEASSKPYITLTGLNATADTIFLNESLASPFPPVAPAEAVDATYILTVGHANGSYLWRMGNNSFPFSLDLEAPLLFNPNGLAKHNLSDLTIRNKNGSWVDIIVLPQGLNQVPHTLHKHSNKFYVIGSGVGTWNFSSVAEAMEVMPESFNLVNPPIRDSYPTLPVFAGMDTWTVYRYQVVNPGAFLFHCHIQTHLDGGMAVALIDGYDVWPDVPEQYTCNGGFSVESCNASPGL